MKVFVVSLKESPRRSKIKADLRARNIDFEFFDAVDAREGVPESYHHRINRSVAKRRLLRPMNDTEFGCALSHALVYEHIVKNQIPHSIILEDDAIITDGFDMLLREKQLENTDINMALLYHNYCYATKKKCKLGTLNYRIPAFMPRSTTAYYIDISATKTLQKATQIIDYVADFPAPVEQRHKVIAFSPRLIRHPVRHEQQTTLITPQFRWFHRVEVSYPWHYFFIRKCYGSFWSYTKRGIIRLFFDKITTFR